ncbi:hypothetical protein F9K79_09410 [Ochrobactrum sp. Kaboul]|nr:hypothetical protein F9K79_09410 [Ochrobactrum sp. Kaboul]
MKSASSFYVFEKWKHATAHAFGSKNQPSLVPKEDKEAYSLIFNELQQAAGTVLNENGHNDDFSIKTVNFSHEFGSRGHRPVDLWVSLYGVESKPLAQMPQIYAIASDRGLEVGFAISIDEADYHDPDVKARNRCIVPILNSKLPAATSLSTQALDIALKAQGGWCFNRKTRLVPSDEGFNQYKSTAELFDDLKASPEVNGGGAICRLFEPFQLASTNLEAELNLAMSNFAPLIKRSFPSPWDMEVIQAQETVQILQTAFEYDPTGQEDARTKILTEVARRQGQATFRKKLLKAYNGKCAITGTTVTAVLQAAHITPYLGVETNHVTNGILLRADLHNLFDLGLLKIDPKTMTVSVSDSLVDTPYAELTGKKIRDTASPKDRPSYRALEKQFNNERLR